MAARPLKGVVFLGLAFVILAGAGFFLGWLSRSQASSGSLAGDSVVVPAEATVETEPQSRTDARTDTRTDTRTDSNSSDSSQSVPALSTQSEKPSFDLKNRTQHPPLEDKEEFLQWMLENTPEEEKYIAWRWDLAQDLKANGMINDKRMMEAFLRTPRENFCREWNLHKAYLDIYMRIGFGVTITDPSVVSRMTETILPTEDQKALEIGTGSGYQSAILAQLTAQVYTIEIIEGLAKETAEIYEKLEKDYLEYTNIRRG